MINLEFSPNRSFSDKIFLCSIKSKLTLTLSGSQFAIYLIVNFEVFWKKVNLSSTCYFYLADFGSNKNLHIKITTLYQHSALFPERKDINYLTIDLSVSTPAAVLGSSVGTRYPTRPRQKTGLSRRASLPQYLPRLAGPEVL